MGPVMTPPAVLGGELKEVMSQFLAYSGGYCHLYYVSLLPVTLSSLWSDNGVVRQIQPHSTAADEPAYSTVCPLWSLNRRERELPLPQVFRAVRFKLGSFTLFLLTRISKRK